MWFQSSWLAPSTFRVSLHNLLNESLLYFRLYKHFCAASKRKGEVRTWLLVFNLSSIWKSLTDSFSLCVCVCVCLSYSLSLCVCSCVCFNLSVCVYLTLILFLPPLCLALCFSLSFFLSVPPCLSISHSSFPLHITVHGREVKHLCLPIFLPSILTWTELPQL